MVRFEALWVTGIILRTNDSDLYPSAEKEPYSDLIIYIVLAFCNIMVLVIFVRFLSSMASTQEQGVETRLAQKIVDAAAEHTLRQVMDAREELWYCLLDKASKIVRVYGRESSSLQGAQNYYPDCQGR